MDIMWIALIIVAGIIAFIWITSEFRKFKHKLWALLLIGLIVFAYISFVVTIQNNNLDLSSPSGIFKAVKVYFYWLGSLFGNMKTLTGSAIHMDWGVNETSIS